MNGLDLSGTVAIITGSGGGIGRSHALELARRGAHVIVNDILQAPASTGPGAAEVAKEIESVGGVAMPSFISCATPDGAAELVSSALETFGRVDAIVHNAAVWHNTTIDHMVEGLIDPVLEVHLKGAFFLATAAWPHMREQNYGRFVLTSSGAGIFGRVNGANYVAAKAGVYGLCRALALEGAQYGIVANCIMPLASTGKNPKTRVKDLRLEPERISPLVSYLVSRVCPVTGEAFSVGMAGHYARIFVGVSDGWWSGPAIPSAEEIAANWDQVEDLQSFSVPASNREFMAGLERRLLGG